MRAVTYVCHTYTVPPIVMLERGLFFNAHGERHIITNAFDEDGDEVDLSDPDVRDDIVAIVARHPLQDGGWISLNIDAAMQDPDDLIVLEDIGWRH